MATLSNPTEVWDALAVRHTSAKGWGRAVDHVREAHMDPPEQGLVVSPLRGALVNQTTEMLAAEAELFLARERLELAVRRRKLASALFWQEAVEQEGLDPEGEYCLDLGSMCIRASQAAPEHVDSDTYRASLDDWSKLVQQALESPLAALRMAQDSTLPRWLGQFAQAVSTTDGSDPADYLAPNLRRLVETWVERPAEARAFSTSDAAEDAPDFLRPLAGLLSQRRRWVAADVGSWPDRASNSTTEA